VIGRAPLPPARKVPIEHFMSGVEDGQRVEVTGVVRTAEVENSLLSVDLVSAGYRFHVFAQLPPGLELSKLIGARVRVRGTAAAHFNAQLRQLITVKVFAPQLEDFVVEEREPVDPFSEPVLPLGRIAQYRKDHTPGKRVHVKGVVTHQRLGEDLFLQDETGGLRVPSRYLVQCSPGDVVEAAGFPDLDHYLPVLADAVLRRTDEPARPIQSRPASTEDLQAGLHHANLITVRGKLIDRIVRRSLDRTRGGMHVKTVLTLQGANMVFSAEAETPEERGDLARVPIGSTVEVTGINLSEIDEAGTVKLSKLLLPSVRPLRVIVSPSWLTPRRLTIGLGVLTLVLVVTVGWSLAISKKNSALESTVNEKVQAQRELQEAHDQLEERVRERTEQLKSQITARKESEVQFKAVLTERTRLAQELHDTLEQTLTGIALQMDTASRLMTEKPRDAGHHMSLARDLVAQGQVDVRRSVWDLRSRVSEQFNLAGALTASSRQLTDGTGIRVEVNARGHVRHLPETIEDNLLRIAQEALTNVIKHSGASSATIDLAYAEDAVSLDVKDNGKGFSTENCNGPQDGHFGLLGISERVKRLSGRAQITSGPGAGTLVHVDIPVPNDAHSRSAPLASVEA
jgi:signal transduction histidine kinase